jgi:flagellar biosynthesis GTPase FlhF
MYVRKFEADSIEEALKEIKRELGPDAVILKTITNKGLKGAFKKNKIEITAAITEKSYTKKAQVDRVLDEGQKGEFYKNSASYIANMIDQHDSVRDQKEASMNSKASYGGLGLNKTVNTTKNIASSIKNGLDDFLSLGEKEEKTAKADFNFEEEIVQRRPIKNMQTQNIAIEENQRPRVTTELSDKDKNKIEELEKKLYELTKSFERIHKKEPIGIYHLRTSLRSLDINEVYIQNLIKKALFELTESDLENSDLAFEFALREMMNTIKTEMPLFSLTDSAKNPVITVFISESSSGQSTMAQKIAAMKKDAVIIRNTNSINPKSKSSFTEKIFDLNIVKTSTIAEMVLECRKSLESGKSVFIDYNSSSAEINETKKFIDGLRRAFPKVEVLITLSAIHTELYNRKVLGTYRRLSDGIVISHLDSCLNFGALFNIAWDINDLPFKFYGTGEVIPDDIETASAERLMAGLFKLN